MKIGIATPCHINDLPFLKECLNSIDNLKPQPYMHQVYLNEGEKSLQEIRTTLFDRLFQKGCDVALQCSADFYLFPKILRSVEEDKTTSFGQLHLPTSISRFTSNMIRAGLWLVWNKCWTGCYSLPREVWEKQVKPVFNGHDSSVMRAVGRNYKFVRKPMFFAMRPWRRKTTEPMIAKMSLLKRLKWRTVRLR